MAIAILGWGSLIRCPGNLALVSKWRKGGPKLPVEFARASSGDRLTLVICADARLQPTFWVLSGCESLEAARDELREREGISPERVDRIHLIDREGTFTGHKKNELVSAEISRWISSEDGIDAAIWTGLGPKWPPELEKPFGKWSHAAALAYLRSLQVAGTHQNAELYFRHAPPEVDTPLRRVVEAELGWLREPLPEVLLEREGPASSYTARIWRGLTRCIGGRR